MQRRRRNYLEYIEIALVVTLVLWMITAMYWIHKAEAPKGFDCIMVPLMVSVDFIKESK